MTTYDYVMTCVYLLLVLVLIAVFIVPGLGWFDERHKARLRRKGKHLRNTQPGIEREGTRR